MNHVKKAKLAKAASNRIWGIVLLHMLCAPLGSAIYSGKQGNWLPFVLATGTAIVGDSLVVIDFGLTAGVIAPFLSVFMLTNKVSSSRRQLGVQFPEEAEAILWKSFETRANELQG